MPYEFITNLVKPWDKLSELLAKPYAFQPEINDPLREAGNIAVALRHQAEKAAVDIEAAKLECPALDVLIDVGDSFKHGVLRNASRNNKLSIASQIEFRQGPVFRFMRNAICVDHVTKGSFDLLELEGKAITYWMQKLQIPLEWAANVQESRLPFTPKITLYFNPEHQIHMKATTLKFYIQDQFGSLVLSDPPHFTFEIFSMMPGQPNK